jgi:6-phosphogluconolactonase
LLSPKRAQVQAIHRGAIRRLDTRALYSLLARGFADRIPWPRFTFWGDERCVPPDHPDSNYRMVRESLLSKISIPSENVHRMAGEKEPKLAPRNTRTS